MAPLAALVELCRTLRHNLAAGLTLHDVFRQQAQRGPAALRDVCAAIAKDLGKGGDLETALNRHRSVFPTLFIELAVVGEHSGSLPEVFEELENYYRLVMTLRRQLWSQAAWPLTQLVIGILVVTLMILILGMLGSQFTPLGKSMTGPKGAITFFGITTGVSLLIFFGGRTAIRSAGTGTFMMRLPVIGPCLTSMALHRFSVALRLTYNTGMPMPQALRLSLRATDSEAFLRGGDKIAKAIETGQELAEALTLSPFFPQEYIDVLSGAEMAGRLDEVLEHQAKYYADETQRRLTTLAKVLGGVIWFLIGAFLVFMIFRIYLGYINEIQRHFP